MINKNNNKTQLKHFQT